MLIKQGGNLQKRHYTQTMLHFCNILSFFVDHVSFLLTMSKFFGANTCIFCTFKFTIYNTMLHFSAYYDMFYGSWVDFLQFTCIFCIFAVHGRHGTVENFVKNFGVLDGSGLNK